MVTIKTLKDHEEWLANRTRIGGSDAACILGLNPWKSNVDLYLEKIGEKQNEDISDKPIVKYGTDAEQYLRELFKLDYPQYKVGYEPNNIWLNEKYPWGHASLDGWLTDGLDRQGIWECKTSNIIGAQRDKWRDKIPDNYYCQLLHYFLITEFDFAVLKAQLKTVYDQDVSINTKHYFIERADCEKDIAILKDAEAEFWEHIQTRTQPALKLPEI